MSLVTFVSCALWWIYISWPVASVKLSEGRSCRMQFHQWYTGRCVLSYYENSTCLGTTKLALGLFTHPWAVFPGPEGKSAVCLSWLDNTYTAFAVDYSKGRRKKVVIPDKLQEAVDESDFEVRACSRREVEFVADFIRTTDSQLLSSVLRGGLEPNESREDVLRFLRWATEPNNYRDPVLKGAKPQILPEN